MVTYNILLKNKENAALKWFGEEKLNELLDVVDEIMFKLEEYRELGDQILILMILN
jgi:hypothetical protein